MVDIINISTSRRQARTRMQGGVGRGSFEVPFTRLGGVRSRPLLSVPYAAGASCKSLVNAPSGIVQFIFVP